MDDAAKRMERYTTKPEGWGKENTCPTPPRREMLDAVPQIVWRARSDGVTEYLNQRWYEFTGDAPSGSEHRWTSFVHPDDLQNLSNLYEIPVGSPEPYNKARLRLKHVSGSYRWFLVQAVPIHDQDSQIVQWLGTCTDIHAERAKEQSERLEGERGARASNEAESRAKDEFLAIVCHELRTPLNAILGWAEILRKSATDARLIHAIESIERNGKIQAQIIADILDSSLIILGKMGLERRLVNPTEIIAAAIDTVRPVADARGIRIALSFSSEKTFILGDPRRLQQVVWNLLTNAVKFTPEGGLVEISLEGVGSDVNITVSDTGEGVDPEILPMIFDRFAQADHRGISDQAGLGLGLSIVQQIVEMHGGRVNAASEGRGKGTTFTVSLPAVPTG